MNLALVDVITVTAAVVGAGIAFTLWKFQAKHGHDPASTRLLKHFFDGKTCAICKRPIAAVHRTGMKPGLLNPETHQTYSWNDISDANLATALETYLPVCSECEVAESFRQRFPGLFVDYQRSVEHADDRVEGGESNVPDGGTRDAAAKPAVVKNSVATE